MGQSIKDCLPQILLGSFLNTFAPYSLGDRIHSWFIAASVALTAVDHPDFDIGRATWSL